MPEPSLVHVQPARAGPPRRLSTTYRAPRNPGLPKLRLGRYHVRSANLVATPDTSSSTQIEPLTRRNREGVLYERLPQVERQIQAAVGLARDELVARARVADPTDPAYLQEEALAYLIRRVHRRGDDDVVNGLSLVIVERCKRSLKSLLSGLGADGLEEATAETIADVFERLVEPEGSDRGDFLQVRFGMVLKRFGLAAFHKAVERSNREKSFVMIGPGGAESEDDEPLRQIPDDVTPPVDTGLMIEEALSVLEPHVRQAFVLRVEGWPVEDRDPNVMTISRYFNKTSRTIRNWLAEAEQQLAAWRNEEAGT